MNTTSGPTALTTATALLLSLALPSLAADQPGPAVLKGHDGYVVCLAFAPDGKTLVTGGSDKAVRVWDVTSRRTVRVLTGHGGLVSSVAYAPGGKVLASASYDRTVCLWDTGTAKALATLQHDDIVTAVAFSPDGKTLAAACGGK